MKNLIVIAAVLFSFSLQAQPKTSPDGNTIYKPNGHGYDTIRLAGRYTRNRPHYKIIDTVKTEIVVRDTKNKSKMPFIIKGYAIYIKGRRQKYISAAKAPLPKFIKPVTH